MRIIAAIIQPCMLNKVTSALEAIKGFPGMTVTEAHSGGRGRNRQKQGAVQIDEFTEKLRLEIVSPSDKVEEIAETLGCAAHTGNGDGIVFDWPVEDAVRIQTGERAEVAL